MTRDLVKSTVKMRQSSERDKLVEERRRSGQRRHVVKATVGEGRAALHTKAMARLDAILGRGADAAPRTSGDKGSNKGSPTPAEASE